MEHDIRRTDGDRVNVRAFGVQITPELIFKTIALAFALGILAGRLDTISEKVSGIEARVIRIEKWIDRDRDRP